MGDLQNNQTDQSAEGTAKLLNLLIKLLSLQASWLLLYICATPRINHLLRPLAPSLSGHLANIHDHALLRCFQQLFALPPECDWDESLHLQEYAVWIRQAQLLGVHRRTLCTARCENLQRQICLQMEMPSKWHARQVQGKMVHC